MSRTIRRRSAYDVKWATTTWETNNNWVWVRVPKDPVTLARDLAKFHSDKKRQGISKWFRREEHVSMRSLVKGELARFWKDPEYEVQVERRRKHDYWD
jgi:hypothetical protein